MKVVSLFDYKNRARRTVIFSATKLGSYVVISVCSTFLVNSMTILCWWSHNIQAHCTR